MLSSDMALDDEADPDATRSPVDTQTAASPGGVDSDAASIRQVISVIGSLSQERRRMLARYAYILVRIARADAEPSEVETNRIEQAVIDAGGLSETQGALVVALAGRSGVIYGPSEDYAVTREFARTSSPQERQRLLRACVAVAAVDGPIVGAEAAELQETGRELGFTLEEIEAIRDQVDPHQAEAPPEGSDPSRA